MKNISDKIKKSKGFTLVEMLVVIAIIMILISALIGISGELMSGSDRSQTYNCLSAMVAAARAKAIEEKNYTAVCCESGMLSRGEFDCYITILSYQKKSDGTYWFKSDNEPTKKLSGFLGFGRLSKPDMIDNNGKVQISTNDQLEQFANFLIIFSPDGTVVQSVDNGAQVKWWAANRNSGYGQELPLNTWSQQSRYGQSAITIFNYRKVHQVSAAKRADYLQDNIELQAVNKNLGMLFERK